MTTNLLRAKGRFGRRTGTGAQWRLGLAAVLGAIILVGHIGIVSHQYEHLGELKPEVVCHLCVAGDHFTPLPAQARLAPELQRDAALSGSIHVAPALRPLRNAHGVRAPPRST